jgi:hypothetical protein
MGQKGVLMPASQQTPGYACEELNVSFVLLQISKLDTNDSNRHTDIRGVR